MSGIFAGRADRTVWKGGWREIGGYKKYYRSRWEANYARWLERERSEGRIVSWAHEPKTFWFEGIKRGVNNYLPDFHVVYPPSGEDGKPIEEYHEVKGWMDPKSATKIKRMGKYFPDVKLVVIDRKIYNKLERECKRTIEGWEDQQPQQPQQPQRAEKKETPLTIPPLEKDWTAEEEGPQKPPRVPKGQRKILKELAAQLE
jgi:hypothetical protein